MVEAPLTLFQVEMEGRHGHAVELLEPALGIAPEALDAVDVTLAIGELVRAMMNSEVFRVADINQSIIAAPAVRMNDRIGRDATANNGLEGDFLAVRDDFRVDASRPRLKTPKTMVLPEAPRPRLPRTRRAPK